MKFILDLFKGAIVGIANIIPGVSGGTMAVSMGIYDKIINSLNGLTKQFKKSFLTLLPIVIGMVVGIGVFSFIIPHCSANYPFQTAMCFVGLVVGGVPELFVTTGNALKKEKHKLNFFHILFFVVFFAIASWMALANGQSTGSDSLEISFINIVIYIAIGIVAAATMVVPGISGSLMLMIMGYYNGIVGTVSSFLTALKNFDGPMIGHCLLILVPFAIGCVIGILLISKIISWLFKKFESVTYAAILGLILASPFAIFYKAAAFTVTTESAIVGLALLVAGMLLSYLMSLKGKDNKSNN